MPALRHTIKPTAGRRFVGMMIAWRKIPKAKAWPVKTPGNARNFHKHRLP